MSTCHPLTKSQGALEKMTAVSLKSRACFQSSQSISPEGNYCCLPQGSFSPPLLTGCPNVMTVSIVWHLDTSCVQVCIKRPNGSSSRASWDLFVINSTGNGFIFKTSSLFEGFQSCFWLFSSPFSFKNPTGTRRRIRSCHIYTSSSSVVS